MRFPGFREPLNVPCGKTSNRALMPAVLRRLRSHRFLLLKEAGTDALAKQKECQVLEGHLNPDHVHMCIAIPPKHPVASVIGFLKGKSAIAIARLGGKERNFSGEHFWARGYAVSTVGFEHWCPGHEFLISAKASDS
jgi:REP element-mobilizing transposase RayT